MAAVAAVGAGAPTAAVFDDGVAATWVSTAAVGRAAAADFSVPAVGAEVADAAAIVGPTGTTGT